MWKPGGKKDPDFFSIAGVWCEMADIPRNESGPGDMLKGLNFILETLRR